MRRAALEYLAAMCVAAFAGPSHASTAAELAERDGGFWAGPFKLCRDSVSKAEISEPLSGGATMWVTLTPEGGREFASITEKAIGQPLEFRLAGEVIMSTTVHEPINGGSFQISGPETENLKAAKSSMETDC
jgi:hypothetical protein